MNRIILKYSNQIILFTALSIISTLIIVGCASRENSPKTLDDSTIIYPSKSENGIYATITFSNKLSKKTGKPVKADTLFKLNDKAKLFVTIDLVNHNSINQKVLMLHINWLDSACNSLYKKQINFAPTDSSSSITSSISISPQKRKIGIYMVRIYLFRELIAEKKFRLVESHPDSQTVKKKDSSIKKIKPNKKADVEKSKKLNVKTEIIKADIVLCRKVSKKSGKPIGAGNVFTIKEKAKIRAIVSFEKQEIKTNEQMNFYFNWIGPNGKSFYKKRVIYTTSNSSFTISNSISIIPEKREVGTYILQVLFEKKIIAEQKFELVAQTK